MIVTIVVFGTLAALYLHNKGGDAKIRDKRFTDLMKVYLQGVNNSK